MKDAQLLTDEFGNQRWDANAELYNLTSIAQKEAYKEKLERDRENEIKEQIRKSGRDSHPFTFTDMDNIKSVIKHVPDKFLGYLLYLQTYVGYNGKLLYTNNHSMSKQDMMRILDIKRRTLSSFLKCMIEYEIINVDNGGTFYIDKQFHWRGPTESAHVIKTFINSIRTMYKDNVNHKDLGFVYKLLPYVHFSTNYLCYNPNEIDAEQLRFITKSDVAELVGVTVKSIYSRLRRLKFGDCYVIAEVKHGKYQGYMLNPHIFYRKDGIPDDTLLATFSISNNYTTIDKMNEDR